MFKLYLSIFFLMVLTQAGCSKKQGIINATLYLADTIACYNPFIDTTPLPPGYVRIERDLRVDARYNLTFPAFNPANTNQFIYVQEDLSGARQAKLIKFDLLTGKSDPIYAAPLSFGDMKWNKYGEIVFDGLSEQVYSINDDGSGRKQITNNQFYNGSPVWYKDGSEILVREDFKRLVLYDKNGNKLDTIPSHGIANTSCQDCNNLNDLVISNLSFFNQFAIIHCNKSVDYYNFSTTDTNNTMIYCIAFNPVNNNEVFFCVLSGLYKYELSSQAVTLIKQNCQSKRIQQFCISPDGQKIIVSMDIRLLLPGNHKVGDHSILYIMDIDGGNGRILNLSTP